jgi:hypothetical protein
MPACWSATSSMSSGGGAARAARRSASGIGPAFLGLRPAPGRAPPRRLFGLRSLPVLLLLSFRSLILPKVAEFCRSRLRIIKRWNKKSVHDPIGGCRRPAGMVSDTPYPLFLRRSAGGITISTGDLRESAPQAPGLSKRPPVAQEKAAAKSRPPPRARRVSL